MFLFVSSVVDPVVFHNVFQMKQLLLHIHLRFNIQFDISFSCLSSFLFLNILFCLLFILFCQYFHLIFIYGEYRSLNTYNLCRFWHYIKIIHIQCHCYCFSCSARRARPIGVREENVLACQKYFAGQSYISLLTVRMKTDLTNYH